MPWCPRCGTEYRSGYDVCSDCSVTLVDTPPSQNTPAVYGYQGGWAFWVNVFDAREAEMLKTWAESENIPVLLRPREPSGDYMGIYLGNTYNIDLYVPEDSLEAARALIGGHASSESETADPETESASTVRTSIGKSLIIWVWLIPMLLGLIVLLLKGLSR
ncbi:MAG: DUF2007 domain-containing protein [Firmicutes bacterium]|nr:DUF2007 domain-containing protein [Bacillota bacterium]